MGIFHQFFLWDVHPEGKVEKHTGWRSEIERERERCKGLEVHSCLWGAVPAQRWMRSFRERESRQSWDRKVFVSYWQSYRTCFLFSPALPALVDAKGGGEGALWSSTGSQQVGALPEPASSYPEADHMPFALSECACRRRKSCGDKSVPGLCIRIHKFILYTKKGAFLRASCAMHLGIC